MSTTAKSIRSYWQNGHYSAALVPEALSEFPHGRAPEQRRPLPRTMRASKEQTLMKSGSKPMNHCLWGYSSESCLACANDRLCPVSHLKLAEDVGDMVAHGL